MSTIALFALVAGCTPVSDVTVELTVRDFTGNAVPLVAADAGLGVVHTGSTGVARVSVDPESPFDIALVHIAYAELHVVGSAGAEDTTLPDLVLFPEAALEMAYSQLALDRDPSRGTVLLSIATAGGKAFTHGDADLDAEYDASFTLEDGQAVESEQLQPDGSTFLGFANVPAGVATLDLEPEDPWACATVPDGGALDEIPVHEDAVTLVGITCSGAQAQEDSTLVEKR